MVDNSVTFAILKLALYFCLCVWYGIFCARKTKIDPGLAVILCLVLSPLIASVVFAFFPPREVRVKTVSVEKQPDSSVRRHSPLDLYQKLKRRLPAVRRLKYSRRKAGFIILGIIVILFLTNPSYHSFQQFAPENKTIIHYAQWRRVHNYGVFSVYQKDVYQIEYGEGHLLSSQRYVGFLLNFISVR